MKEYFGKKIDPESFKQDFLEDLEKQVKKSRENAKEFVDRATVPVDYCPICDSSQRTTVQHVYEYEYVQCTDCRHVYPKKRLSDEALNEFYESDEDYASTYTDREQVEYRLENITRPKFDFVLEHIDEESGRWLDIGCGVGASVSYLDSLGWDVVGLDISQHSIQAGKELFGVDLRQQTLIDFLEQNPNAEFDVVSFMGYFDVVSEPIHDLERATTLLGDKGHVAIGVQQFDSVSTLVQQTFNEQVTRHLIPPNIVQMFTHQSLQRTYEKLGVDQQAVWYFGLDFYTLLNNLCLSIDGFQESELYEMLMTNYNEFQEVIDRNKKSDYLLTVGRYSDE